MWDIKSRGLCTFCHEPNVFFESSTFESSTKLFNIRELRNIDLNAKYSILYSSKLPKNLLSVALNLHESKAGGINFEKKIFKWLILWFSVNKSNRRWIPTYRRQQRDSWVTLLFSLPRHSTASIYRLFTLGISALQGIFAESVAASRLTHKYVQFPRGLIYLRGGTSHKVVRLYPFKAVARKS